MVVAGRSEVPPPCLDQGQLLQVVAVLQLARVGDAGVPGLLVVGVRWSCVTVAHDDELH